MKAIMTKYVGPSNTKGSRIIASDGDGHRVESGYDSRHNSERNHFEAAFRLAERMKWTGKMKTLQGGHLLRGGRSGVMVWVWEDKDLLYPL